MDETSLSYLAIFAVGFALSLPLGWFFRIRLSEGRYSHLDGMRAIAALLVVCSHAVPQVRTIYDLTADTPLTRAAGAVGVQIFFAITAFLFARKAMAGPVDIPALISSRVRRIVPLYMLCMTAAVIFAAYIGTTLDNPVDPREQDIIQAYAYGFFAPPASISGISIIGLIGQAWTLAWEWSFYLLVPFLTPVLTRWSWRIAAAGFALLCGYYQMSEGAPQVWVFFLPGILAALIEPHVRLSRVSQMVLFLCGIAAYGIALTADGELYGLTRLMLSAVGFSCLLFGWRGALSIWPLRLLGEVSYSIYMLQMLVVTGFVRIARVEYKEFFPTIADKLQLGLEMLAGFFLLAFLTYALIERPFMASKRRPALDADLGTRLPAAVDQGRTA